MVLPICAKLEEDIAGMDAEEKEMFLSELGLHESGLDRLIKVCYDLLGLMSYLTAGEQEVRAWTIEKGTKAPQACGKIHTDFERGFIRAEVINYKDLIELGSLAAVAREKGLVRSEGKEYVMQDGDVVLFRFQRLIRILTQTTVVLTVVLLCKRRNFVPCKIAFISRFIHRCCLLQRANGLRGTVYAALCGE